MLADRYGCKSGFLRHWYALGLMHAGMLRPFVNVAVAPPSGRAVFVCKGNIARSAYAEARMRMMGFDTVASAGLHAKSGTPTDPAAVRAAAARGVDLSRHCARRVEEIGLGPRDHAFVFEICQARALSQMTSARVFLLGVWACPARPHIEDPFGCGTAYYSACFDVIDSALQRLRHEEPTDAPFGAALV